MSIPISRHTLRQIEYVLPGALITYYYRTPLTFWHILSGGEGSSPSGIWAQKSAFVCLTLGLSTVAFFIYILLIPVIKGQQPNYRLWRESNDLATVIPLLTASIVAGWSLSAFTLGHWSSLGYIGGVVATSGFYALNFGILGLLPAPQVRRQ